MLRSIALMALLIASPAFAAGPNAYLLSGMPRSNGNPSHQGTAKTPDTLAQWSTAPFAAKGERPVQLGKTGKLTCNAAAGCVLYITLAVAVRTTKTATFTTQMEVDGNSTEPEEGFGATCPANHTTALPNVATIVVAQGTHTIEYALDSTEDLIVFSWSAQAQMHPKS